MGYTQTSRNATVFTYFTPHKQRLSCFLWQLNLECPPLEIEKYLYYEIGDKRSYQA